MGTSGDDETALDHADLTMGYDDTVVTAVITGEVDLHNAELVGSQLLAGIPAGARYLVFDVSGLTYLDSAGIRMVLSAQSALSELAVLMAVSVAPDSTVHPLLGMTGLGELLPLVATPADGITLLRSNDRPKDD